MEDNVNIYTYFLGKGGNLVRCPLAVIVCIILPVIEGHANARKGVEREGAVAEDVQAVIDIQTS